MKVSATMNICHHCRGFHPFSPRELLPYCRPPPGAEADTSGILITKEKTPQSFWKIKKT